MSDFNIISPIIVGDANITASNVALETAWSAGTYSLGTQRRVGERLYEVAVSSTSQEPSANASDWFDAGPANRFAAFDVVFGIDQLKPIETVTRNADTITMTLEGLSRISGIAMLGLVAETIQIVATRTTPGDLLDITYNLQDDREINGSVWNLFFLPQNRERIYTNFDVNIPPNATIEITISNVGGTAEVGVIGLGLVSKIGEVTKESSWAQRENSFTKIERNLVSVVRVLPSETITYDVMLRNNQVNTFRRLMQDISGIATIYSNGTPELTTYGLGKAQFTALGGGNHKFKVEVRGI